MIRLLLFFVLLALVAWGGVYLVEHPGHITLDWFGYQVETSAALLVIAIALAAVLAWIVLRTVVGLPSFVAYAARRRRREKGYDALSRGLVAVNAGDARTAGRASAQATRQLKDDPLALMLRAQSAQLAGDARGAIQAYQELAQREDTRLLGLRGLHAEASRRGDDEAAHHFAAAAHKVQPLSWTAQAQLGHHATAGHWEEALRTVEAAAAARQIDRETGDRQRAVLETAIGYDKEMSEPDAALALARAAMKRAPDLAPPVVLATRLLSRRGDIRKAAKLVEAAWPRCPHPDVAEAYMNVRPGDSTSDRLSRARTLMGLSAHEPVGRLTVARAALANTDYAAARAAMEPLVGEGKRPTVKMCLLMAELEEAEHGDNGLWREWLARASRAALDPAWMADGVVYDEWAPASPTTGRLDAFRWQVPAERPGMVMDALPPRRDPALSATALQAALPPARDASLSVPEAAAPEPYPAAAVAREADPAPSAALAPTIVVPSPLAEATPSDEPAPVPAPTVPALAEPSPAAPVVPDMEDKAAAILALPSVPAHDEPLPASRPEPGPLPVPGPDKEKRARSIYSSG